jgi:hypothetical protein
MSRDSRPRSEFEAHGKPCQSDGGMRAGRNSAAYAVRSAAFVGMRVAFIRGDRRGIASVYNGRERYLEEWQEGKGNGIME